MQLMLDNNFTFSLQLTITCLLKIILKNYPLAVIILVAHDNTYDTIMELLIKLWIVLKKILQDLKL